MKVLIILLWTWSSLASLAFALLGPSHQPLQAHSHSSALAAAATSTESPTTTAKLVHWNFQGFDCYAEIAKPTTITSSFFSKPKPQVVLIHGFGCSTVYWRETTRALNQAGYTVHAVDLLGQGKSAKPGKADGVEYSINLWAEMVEQYTQQFVVGKDVGVVVVGNSLGSLVALAAATGDQGATSRLPSRIQGIGMYNCGIGMNSRNLLRDPSWNPIQRALLAFVFDTLDNLIFDNVPLLTYVLDKVVTKKLLQNALIGLYQCAEDPQARVDEALVDSFYLPAKEAGSVEALNQIYTNDPGKTPMELHQDHAEFLQNIPIHLVWGTKDNVTPLEGSVGQFYVGLAEDPNNKNPVSISIVESGHIPFDEIPESNDSMIEWMEQVVTVAANNNKQAQSPGFPWPFSQ